MAKLDFDKQWWPAREDWPEYREYYDDQITALLLLEGAVFPLADSRLYVLCNDLFYWGSADAEPMPQPEFEQEKFKDLYERVRKDGGHGAEVWCCLQRGMRPQTPIEKLWRDNGQWTAELEALPGRDPESRG